MERERRPFSTEEGWADGEGLGIIYDIIVPRPTFPAPTLFPAPYCTVARRCSLCLELGGCNRRRLFRLDPSLPPPRGWPHTELLLPPLPRPQQTPVSSVVPPNPASLGLAVFSDRLRIWSKEGQRELRRDLVGTLRSSWLTSGPLGASPGWAEDQEGSGTQASRSPGLRETECLPLGSFQYDG